MRKQWLTGALLVLLALLLALPFAASAEEAIDCPHEYTDTNTYIDGVWKDDGNGKTHSVTGVEYEVTYCTVCYETLAEIKLSDSATYTDDHYFRNGVCVGCGAKNTCTHPQIETSTYIDGDWKDDGNGKTHSVTGVEYEVKHCTVCYETLAEIKLSDSATYTDDHYFTNGVCSTCGAKNTCTHPNLDSYVYVDGDWADDGNGKTHSRTGERVEMITCLVCGEEISEKKLADQATETFEHSFIHGVCDVCGAKNTCTHPKTDIYEYVYGEYKDDGNGKTHTAVGAKYRVEECMVCGEVLSEKKIADNASQTYSHYFSGGICLDCNAINTCKHPSTEKIVWINGVYQDDGNGKTHTASGVKYENKECTVCGETLSSLAIAYDVTESQPHTYINDNGKEICAYCRYERAVSTVKPTKVALNKTGTVQLGIGETLSLTVAFTPADAGASLTWTSSKPAVATVADGVVTAKAEGKTKITVATDNKKKATVTIQVVDPNKVTKIAFADKTIALSVGQEAKQLVPVLTPATADASTLKWSSNKPAIATVNANGEVTPVAEGTAKITVTAPSKKKATITIKVTDPYKPTAVKFENAIVNLKVGDTFTLNPVLAPETAKTTFTYKSAKPKIASVDGNGVVTALKKGKAKITVTTANKKKATITIVVE